MAHDRTTQEIIDLKKEVKCSKDKLRSFFESSGVIHLLVDTKLQLIDFNRAAADFARKRHQIEIRPGIKVITFLHPHQISGFIQNCQKALGGTPVRMDHQFTYGEETIFWFVNFEPALDCEKKILGVSFNAFDITEKLANENKIAALYHSLNEIAYIQAHELPPHLNTIGGLMDLFEGQGQMPEKELMMLKRAIGELKAQLKIIEGYAA